MSRVLNGSSDRLRLTPVSATTAISISAWIKINTLPGASVHDMILNLVDSTQSEPYANNAPTLYLTSAGQLKARMYDTSYAVGRVIGGAATLGTGTWIHVGLSIAPSAPTGFSIWTNGTQDATTGCDNSPVYTAALMVGGLSANSYWSDTTTNNAFDGKITGVGVWNRALSGTEWANLAAGGHPLTVAPTSLQAYALFNSSLVDSVHASTWIATGGSYDSDTPTLDPGPSTAIARISQVAVEIAVLDSTPIPARISQEAVEILILDSTPIPARLSQIAVEVAVVAVTTGARITQSVIKALIETTPDARVSQSVIKALVAATADARISQSVIKVLAETVPTATGPGPRTYIFID